ncbi:MAG: cob(I)yrinic acid a,c-diamide adenosyltransferase [Candidatus Cloacimonetes bacterium]|nr:cob(I)yrinic acid a,c-diamide adenosyltransferase [Candidatus Cloacimonadota bacterium]
MSITTKTGDGGQTSLYSGERVWKDDLRVQAYGALDELDAHLGDARHLISEARVLAIVEDIQNMLYRVMGELATPGKEYPYPITEKDVADIGSLISELEADTPVKGFVIPGSLPASARLDICRAIARRAERQVVALARAEQVSQPLRQYVNRLSDLLYILARTLEGKAGAIRYKHKPQGDT